MNHLMVNLVLCRVSNMQLEKMLCIYNGVILKQTETIFLFFE